MSRISVFLLAVQFSPLSPLVPFITGDFILFFLIARYIHREFVAKNVFSPSALPSILEEWVNENSALCMFTEPQVADFSLSHLVAGG